MKWLIDLFKGGNPIADTIKAIDGVTTSGAERIELKKQFITQVVDAQAKVISAEASAGSWLTQSWRPIVMLCFAGILVYSFFFGPMFGLKTVPLPPELWILLQVGIGGYVGGRTVEKLVPMLAKKGKK
jgi:hypothetical protein